MNCRQKKFFEHMSPNSCAIFFSQKMPCCNVQRWPGAFVQESNFWYLLPIDEDQSALILFKDEYNHSQTLLFCASKNPHFEQWQGVRQGVKRHQDRYPNAKVYDIKQLTVVFESLLKNVETLYYGWGIVSSWDQWMLDIIQKVQKNKDFSISLKDWRVILQHLRSIKSEEELNCLKKSAEITALAFQRVAQRINTYDEEYQIQSDLYAVFGAHGASPAYPAIVASGINGLCLHYGKNSAPIQDGQTLVIDAGCEYKGYVSDVTRTFFKGLPSTPWKKLYHVVKKTQQSIIDAIKPGVRLMTLEALTCKLLAEGLMELGILKRELCGASLQEELKLFYPHSMGHWIGLDVHDLGPSWRKKETVLQPNMALTVEPGLYIPQHNQYAPYSGLCIRIEDVICVTAKGCCNLTESILK